MFSRDVLSDGSLRLAADGCAFLFTRLSPGRLLTTIDGFDSGKLGTAPLEEVSAEVGRFKRPLTWFIDARNSPNAVSTVFERWIEWLYQRRDLLDKVFVLTGSKPLSLTVNIARHLSQSERLMKVINDLDSFEFLVTQGQSANAPSPLRSDRGWTDADANNITRQLLTDGTIEIADAHCRFTFKRIDVSTTLTTICGVDNGSLGNAAFDYMGSELDSCVTPVSWFVNCTEVTSIGTRTAEDWTQWISARQKLLKSVVMLAPAGALPLLIDIAKYQSGTQSIIRIVRDVEKFGSALRTSGKPK